MKWWKVAGLLAVALVSFGSSGCSHQAGVEASSPAFSSGNGLPFARTSDKTGVFPTTAYVRSEEVPAGTVISVRIHSVLSSLRAKPGDSFEALLDSPIQVDGVMVAPRDSLVSGKVLAAKAFAVGSERAYLRLELTEITLHGKSLPVHSAAILVKGPLDAVGGSTRTANAPASRSSSEVEFPSARPLTFRLTESFSAPS